MARQRDGEILNINFASENIKNLIVTINFYGGIEWWPETARTCRCGRCA